jgi:hypothetical protein
VQDVYTQIDFEKLVGIEVPELPALPAQALVKETLFEVMKRVVNCVSDSKVVSSEYVSMELKIPLEEVERLLDAAQRDRVIWRDVNGLWRFTQ